MEPPPQQLDAIRARLLNNEHVGQRDVNLFLKWTGEQEIKKYYLRSKLAKAKQKARALLSVVPPPAEFQYNQDNLDPFEPEPEVTTAMLIKRYPQIKKVSDLENFENNLTAARRQIRDGRVIYRKTPVNHGTRIQGSSLKHNFRGTKKYALSSDGTFAFQMKNIEKPHSLFSSTNQFLTNIFVDNPPLQNMDQQQVQEAFGIDRQKQRVRDEYAAYQRKHEASMKILPFKDSNYYEPENWDTISQNSDILNDNVEDVTVLENVRDLVIPFCERNPQQILTPAQYKKMTTNYRRRVKGTNPLCSSPYSREIICDLAGIPREPKGQTNTKKIGIHTLVNKKLDQMTDQKLKEIIRNLLEGHKSKLILRTADTGALKDYIKQLLKQIR